MLPLKSDLYIILSKYQDYLAVVHQLKDLFALEHAISPTL